ncbi:MAG: ABC transporter ATP-binding protein [Phycisphaerales bacterium]|nr:ABC transporter ATP-binding protein [Phycisphaerales bacterium]
MLEICDLRFRYGTPGAGWIVDISRLDVGAGEQVLLTGTSGRGKSTLLNLIAGILDPVEGRVVIDGVEVHALRGAARDRFRGRTIGMIFQTFNLLLGFTAEENVMAALMFSGVPRGEHRERARGLLKRLGMVKYESPAESLSVGQQQRVAVARAVACGPKLVLADEPTASLDPDSGRAAMDLVQGVCREIGAALVCVSHDPSMGARFERRERLEELSRGAAHAAVPAEGA